MERKYYLYTGIAILASAGIGLYFLNRKEELPLDVAPNVDLDKYLGEWYEIARLPAPFEKQCYSTKARYSRKDDGTIEVENTCNMGNPNGRFKKARGTAYVADTATNAKLKVKFFWPFKGDYWILDVGKQYEYALVGEPSRKYLWILSRTPTMEKSLIEQLVQKALNRGFNTHKLIFTRHSEEVPEKV